MKGPQRSTLRRFVFIGLVAAAVIQPTACIEAQSEGEALVRNSPDEEEVRQGKWVRYDPEEEGVLKFDASGGRWRHQDLTWCVESFTEDLSEQQVLQAFEAAAVEWSRVTPLSFARVEACRSANLRIGFGVGDHGDNSPFDGLGGTLAHAYFPRNGRVHFDDDERWTMQLRQWGNSPTDLQTVALHEFGHALGLRHSNVKEAVMYAFYGGSRRRLTQDDIDGIQSIYGPNPGEPEHDPPPSGDDHGDGMDNATPTSTNSITEGRLDPAGDSDYFRIDPTSRLELTLQTSGETDTLCELRDARDNTLQQDDDSGDGRNCRMVTDLDAGGVYYIRVRHYSSSGVGPYTLALSATEFQPDPEPDPEPGPQPEPEPQPDPEPDAEPEPEPEPQPDPEPEPQPDPSIDRDGDGVPNDEDRCRETPQGDRVWQEGQWRGCSGGQSVSPEPEYDSDSDGVPDTEDECRDTPPGARDKNRAGKSSGVTLTSTKAKIALRHSITLVDTRDVLIIVR